MIFSASVPAVQGGSITKGIPGTRMHPDSAISYRGGSITQVCLCYSWQPEPSLTVQSKTSLSVEVTHYASNMFITLTVDTKSSEYTSAHLM